MTRRVPISFIVGDKTVKRLRDLKEVLQNNPAELLPAIEDGRLKRFLRGYGPKFEQLFQHYSDPKELLQALANLLNVELGEFKEIPQYIKTPKELLKNLGKREELPLGKGIFEVEQLILNKPTLLKGLGRNETLIKAKLIVIANPNVEFERLTVETETVVFLEPIKKLKRASFIAKENATILDKQVIASEDAEFKVGKEIWEFFFNSNSFEIWTKDSFKKGKKEVQNKTIFIREDIILKNTQISDVNLIDEDVKINKGTNGRFSKQTAMS